MKIYKCISCRYLFEYPHKPERCPDCGKRLVKIATAEEQKEYHQYRIEFGYEEPAKVG